MTLEYGPAPDPGAGPYFAFPDVPDDVPGQSKPTWHSSPETDHGMVQPQRGVAQEGPMLVWTSGAQREAIILGRAADPAGLSAWLQARTSDVAEFLADALRTMAIRTATQ